MGEEFFAVRGLEKSFQGVRAVNGVDLAVEQGSVHGVIGPNGAGKTTFFNLITGITMPDRGEVRFRGQRLNRLPPHAVCARGIARTFQNIMLMPKMSVLENVLVGQHARTPTDLLGIIALPARARRIEEQARAVAADVLQFVGLWERCDDLAANLAYGQQRLLEIARAMATQPALLLLDEPAAGMNPAEKVALVAMVRRIRERGITVLIIEHDMKLIMNICDRISVLDFGQKIAEGTPEEVRRDQKVREAYLGRTGT